MAQTKYLDLTGLSKYDAKVKEVIDAKDATTLQSAKDFANGLASNYDAAGSAATAKNGAIEAAKGYTDGEITKVNSTVAEAKKTADKGVADAAAAKSVADAAKSEVAALKTYVGTIPEEAGVASVVAYVDKKTEGMASDALLKQLQSTVGQHTTDISGLKEKDTELQSGVDAAKGSAASNKATIDQLVGSDNGKSIRTIANEELAAQLIPETADETLNTLKEVADWIQKHPNDAAAMNSEISKIKTLIGTIPGEGVTATDITGYIAEVKTALEQSVDAEKSRAESIESGLRTDVDTIKGKVGDTPIAEQIATAKQAAIDAASADATKKADKALADAKAFTTSEVSKIQTSVEEMDGKVTALEQSKHTHANKSVLDGISQEKVSQWDGANAYTDQKIGEFVSITEEEINALFAMA